MSATPGSRRVWGFLTCVGLLIGLSVAIAPPSRAAAPVQTTFTLEGCDRPGGSDAAATGRRVHLPGRRLRDRQPGDRTGRSSIWSRSG